MPHSRLFFRGPSDFFFSAGNFLTVVELNNLHPNHYFTLHNYIENVLPLTLMSTLVPDVIFSPTSDGSLFFGYPSRYNQVKGARAVYNKSIYDEVGRIVEIVHTLCSVGGIFEVSSSALFCHSSGFGLLPNAFVFDKAHKCSFSSIRKLLTDFQNKRHNVLTRSGMSDVLTTIERFLNLEYTHDSVCVVCEDIMFQRRIRAATPEQYEKIVNVVVSSDSYSVGSTDIDLYTMSDDTRSKINRILVQDAAKHELEQCLEHDDEYIAGNIEKFPLDIRMDVMRHGNVSYQLVYALKLATKDTEFLAFLNTLHASKGKRRKQQ